MFAENLDGSFQPTDPRFVTNDGIQKSSKGKQYKDRIANLIGIPQIDYVRDEKRRIQIIVVIEVWDKQVRPPKITEKPKATEIFVYEGTYLEDEEFLWNDVPIIQDG